VNGGSQKFYTWWTLSVIREVTTWIFSWSSLNYRVGQKWRNLAYFQTRPANVLLSRLNAAAYCNSEKNLLSTGGCTTRNATFRELWCTNPWDPRATLLFLKSNRLTCFISIRKIAALLVLLHCWLQHLYSADSTVFIARQHTDAWYWYSKSVCPFVGLSVRP